MDVRRASLSIALVAASLVPSTASAQKDGFANALLAFRTVLAGPYGDEGPQIEAALARMASSLAEWDREVAAAEVELRRGLSAAPAEDRLRRLIALATLNLDRDRWAEALGDLDQAVAAHPHRAFVHLARGMVRDAAGDATGAVSDFERAWDLDRGDPVKAYLLVTRGLAAGALDDPGPPLDALVAAHREATTEDTPPVFMEIGLLRDRAEWPVLAPAAYAEGFALVADGRYAEAVASFRAVVARDPLLIDPARTEDLARGIASLREGQLAAAIAHLEAAVTASPVSAEAHRLLGTAYHLAGRPAECLDRLGTAIRLAPADERARLALARALLAGGRLEEAEATLRETIAVLPASAEARWALAQLYVQRGRGPEAIAELEALSTFPVLAGRGQLGWLLADLHSRHQHQDFDAMTRALSGRVRRDLNSPVVHKEFGLAHLKRGDRRQALAELLMTALVAPEDVETLARIGQIHLDDGRHAEAEVVLRRVVARAPDRVRSRFALGMTLLGLGRTEEGQAELAAFRRLTVARRKAEAQKIEFETLLRNAERSASDGRLDEAIASLERAAVIVDDDPRVYRLLASVYGALGRTEDQARALAAYERVAGTRAVAP
jgi:tetratricopeptide (TPR) repeat protein